MRRDDDPPLRAMDEHVCDVSCLPMPPARIGYTIAFAGLNHSRLAEDANRGLIDYVLENLGRAADRRDDGRLILGMIIEPAAPIISHEARHECAVTMHVCLSPPSIEREEGITKSSSMVWPEGRLCGERPGRWNQNE